MNRTQLFLNGVVNKDYTLGFKEPEGRVFKIDDCYIKQEITRVDTGKTLQELKSSFRNHLPEYINSRLKYISEDVPIMSYEMYLKELKDSIVSNDEFNKSNLSRLWIQGGEGLEVGNVIVTNKNNGNYLLINELYCNNHIVQTVEYDLKEALKAFEQINK